MFFFTAKLTPAKIIAGAAALLMVVGLVVFFVWRGSGSDVAANAPVGIPEQDQSGKFVVSGDDSIISFLRSYGWEISGTPSSREVTIPETFDEVFEKYNAMQKKQGFDLEPYKGMKVKRYTFVISNYPGGAEPIVANVLVSIGDSPTIIGGDVCTKRLDGFMHGFAMPDGSASGSSSSASSSSSGAASAAESAFDLSATEDESEQTGAVSILDENGYLSTEAMRSK